MLQIVEKKYEDSPNSGHVYYLASNYNLGIKNYSKALTYAEKCLRIRNQIKDKIDLMLIQVLICEIYLKLENYEKMKSYADLCQLMLKYYNNKNIQAEVYYYLYTYNYFIEKNITEAEKYIKLNIKNIDEDPESSTTLANRYSLLGELHEIARKFDKAKACYEKSLTITKNHCGTDNIDYANYEEMIGSINLLQNDPEKALECFFNSLEKKIEKLGNSDKQIMWTYFQISNSYFKMNEFLLALEYAQKIPDLLAIHSNKRSKDFGFTFMLIGEIYEKLMNRVKARSFFSQAREIFAQNEMDDQVNLLTQKIFEIDC